MSFPAPPYKFTLIRPLKVFNTNQPPDPTKAIFLVPDIDYLKKFIEGNLGIADNMKQAFCFKNLAMLKSEEGINVFLKTSGSSIGNKDPNTGKVDKVDFKQFLSNNKFNLPKNVVSFDMSQDIMGLKALEITTIKSIFESQKPYVEVIELFLKSLANIEDIIARVLAAPVVNPTRLSQKPKSNPAALGYKPNQKAQKDLIKKMRAVSGLNKDGSGGSSVSSSGTQVSTGGDQSYTTEEFVLSTDYSTGTKLDGYEYDYEERIIVEDLRTNEVDDPFDNEPPDDVMPKVVIFGYFDKDGNSVTPPDWIVNSGKWFGQFGQVDYDDTLTGGEPSNANILKKILKVKSIIQKRIDLKKSKLKPDELTKLFPMEGLSDDTKILNTFGDLRDDIIELIKDDLKDAVKTAGSNSFLLKGVDRNNVPWAITSKMAYEENEITGQLVEYSDGSINVISNNVSFVGTTGFTQSGNITVSLDPEVQYQLRLIEVDTSNSVSSTNSHLMQLDNRNPNPILNENDYESIFPVINASTGETDTLPTPRSMTTLYRYTSVDSTGSRTDTNKYYIIEGILSTNDRDNTNNNTNTNNTGSGGVPKYYIGDIGALSAIKPFANLLVDVAIKLLPKVKALIKLFKDPVAFLADIIMEKVKDGFQLFDPKLVEDFLNLFKLINNPAFDKFNDDLDKKKKIVRDARKKVLDDNPILKNYVHLNLDTFRDEYVDKFGDVKFLLDGSAAMQLFNFKFGFQIDKMLPKPDIGILNLPKPKLDCGVAENLNTSGSGINFIEYGGPSKNNSSDQPNNSGVQSTGLNNNNLNPSDLVDEVVSIKYSTGVKRSDYEYDYIYLYENTAKFVKEGDDYVAQLEKSDPNSDETDDLLTKAMNSYNMALETDPKNEGVKEKIKGLKAKFLIKVQPIFQFLINMVSFPIKVILQILQKIICFFKNIKLPQLPAKIVEFLSFKWILDILKPQKLLELIGIKFDIPKLQEWVANYKTYAEDFKFDLSEIISMPLISQLPAFNKEAFPNVITQPFKFLNAILMLIEGIINAFICFIWALLGLRALMKCPKVKFSKDLGEDMSIKDLIDLMSNNGTGNTGTQYTTGGDDETPQEVDLNDDISAIFLYDITLPDGRTVKDLDYNKLKDFMEKHSDVNYDLPFADLFVDGSEISNLFKNQ